MHRELFLICLLLFAIFNMSQAKFAEKSVKPRKFIINTDAGGDDALAILLALKYEAAHKDDIEIIAITCSFGNTEEKNVENNVLKTLTIANRNNIPVYAGAEKSLLRNYKNSDLLFGSDGFGDFEFKPNISAKIDKSKYAAVALIDLVKVNPGEISIISLGPLTNIALAIELDSTFIQNVDELIIMGASVNGIGNDGPNVEFNFGADPESNFIVLNSTIKPCILVPWDLVYISRAGKDWRRSLFGKLNSPSVDFLNKVDAIMLSTTNSWSGIDAVATVIIIWPEIIKKFIVTNVTPVYDGEARGSVLVDYRNMTGKPHNAKIIQEYDLELFKAKLVQYFFD